MTEKEFEQYPVYAYVELLRKLGPEHSRTKALMEVYKDNERVLDKMNTVQALWYAHKIL
jgi:hypothetical protein